MEQVQKALPNSCESPGASTSSCSSSSAPSPASNTNTPPPSAAGASPSAATTENEEPEIKMEVTDEPIDVCQFIPEPVRKNEPILKPVPKEENISFAKLLQMDNLKPYIYNSSSSGGGGCSVSGDGGRVEAMDTSPSPRAESSASAQTSAPEAQDVKGKSSFSQSQSSLLSPGTNQGTKQQASEMSHSPLSDSGSSGESVQSLDSPPDLVEYSSNTREQLTSVQEEDENLFKDLLEITKNDTEDQLPKEGDGGTPMYASCQNYLFASSSPDNLSQLLGSPSNASVCLDSPGPDMSSMNDGASPRTPECPDGTLNDGLPSSLPNGILAGLLNSKVGKEVATSIDFNNVPSNNSMFSMSVTKIDQSPTAGIDSDLPGDIVDFSLDFCRNVVEQTTSDIVASLAGNLDLVQSFETTIVDKPGSTIPSGAVISEVDDTANPSTCRTINSQQNVGTEDTSPLHCQTEPVTPATPVRNDFSEQGRTVGQTENTYPIPISIPVPTTVSIPTEGASEAQSVSFPSLQQQQTNVTERISKLNIKDNQRLENQVGGKMERTPLLHALLTGAEANPVAVQPVVSAAVVTSAPTSTSTAGLQNGANGLQEHFVDSFDVFLQDLNAGNAQQPDNSGINNNMMNQDDLTLLQAQEQQRLLLLEEQKKQQEQLLLEQQAQQKLMEEKFKEQLLQRKRLQSAMEMNQKLQQGQVLNMMNSPGSSKMNVLPQKTVIANSQQQIGITQGQLQQQLRMPTQTVTSGEAPKQQANYPIPNLSAADIQRLQQQNLQQQNLQQQQIKQQLLLQQRHQQELQQMQQQQQVIAQQQPAQGTSAGQQLLLQQALLQQPQVSQPALISQFPVAGSSSSLPQFSLVSNATSATSFLTSNSQWTPTTNGTESQVQ